MLTIGGNDDKIKLTENGGILMKKYVFYFTAQLLSIISLIGYMMVGNYLFELNPTGETFDVFDGMLELTPYVYVEPFTGVIGVLIQSAGIFLFCVCFGILAKYCKMNLNNHAKHISFTIYAIVYIIGAFFLFTNNFAMLNLGDRFAIKEIWANALNFAICFSACVFGFCSMYYFKNENNHLIY